MREEVDVREVWPRRGERCPGCQKVVIEERKHRVCMSTAPPRPADLARAVSVATLPASTTGTTVRVQPPTAPLSPPVTISPSRQAVATRHPASPPSPSPPQKAPPPPSPPPPKPSSWSPAERIPRQRLEPSGFVLREARGPEALEALDVAYADERAREVEARRQRYDVDWDEPGEGGKSDDPDEVAIPDPLWLDRGEEQREEPDEFDADYLDDFDNADVRSVEDVAIGLAEAEEFLSELELDLDDDEGFERIEEVRHSGRLTPAERAEAASMQIAWQHDLGPREGRELAGLFEEHVWGITRQAITRLLEDGCTVDEIRVASDIRSIWVGHPEFSCNLGRGARVQSIPWDMAVRLARGFGADEDPIEVEWFLERLHGSWYDRQVGNRPDHSFFLYVFALSHSPTLLRFQVRQPDGYSPAPYADVLPPFRMRRVERTKSGK